MIGGYIYQTLDPEFEVRLVKGLNRSFKRIKVWDNGFLFFDEPFDNFQTPWMAGDEMIAVCQDLLINQDCVNEYKLLDFKKWLPDLFASKRVNAFNNIASDFRMAIAYRGDGGKNLFLTSNRAGAGRIYFHKLESGVFFCSDLRFLLTIVGLNVNGEGIYSILKYGAIPEPMTISNNVSVVPPSHYLKYELENNGYSFDSYFQFKFEIDSVQGDGIDYNENLSKVKDLLQKSSKCLNKLEPAILLSGGIDSSLYASYMKETTEKPFQGFYCVFDENDPEFPYAKRAAKWVNAELGVARMKVDDAIDALEEVVRLTDHPFADFSSLPIAFLLKYIKEKRKGPPIIIECNGGDDCFGFPALGQKWKHYIKHIFPNALKRLIVAGFKNSAYWKWESKEGLLASLSAIVDVQEYSYMNYFLVQTPFNYLRLKASDEWEKKISNLMNKVFEGCGEKNKGMSYEARNTIRQLIHINSRLWTAKALSVGESLGLRLVYPYIWRDILEEQGKLPWDVKIHNGIVKWPLKKLLEEFMPKEFIYRKKSGFVPPFVTWLTHKNFNLNVRDMLLARKSYIREIVPRRILEELLSDSLNGKKLRYPVLNFLWGAIFTESWIQRYQRQ